MFSLANARQSVVLNNFNYAIEYPSPHTGRESPALASAGQYSGEKE
jgi:hypothetical protein